MYLDNIDRMATVQRIVFLIRHNKDRPKLNRLLELIFQNNSEFFFNYTEHAHNPFKQRRLFTQS